MTAATPDFTDDLADLFRRYGLDGHAFFEGPEDVIEGLVERGNLALRDEDFQSAETAYFDALRLAQLTQNRRLEASIKNHLSGVMDVQGRLVEALNFLEESLYISQRLGDVRGQAVALCNIGGIKVSMGRFDAAMNDLKAALDHSESIKDTRLSLLILLNIARNYNEEGHWESSALYFKEARIKSAVDSSIDIITACLLNEGDNLLHLKRPAQAKAVLEEALEISRLHAMTGAEASALDGLGTYYEQIGDWPHALHNYRAASELARSIDYAEGQLNAVLNLGRVNIGHGDRFHAAHHLHEALRLATRLDRPKSRRDAHLHLSRLYKQSGELALALEHHEAFHAEEQALSSAERDKTSRTLMLQFDVERAQTQTRAEREQREQAEASQARAEQLVRERTADLEQAQMEVVGRLAMAAEFRDDATGEHTRRVGVGSALIAEALGLSRPFIDTLQTAARLHDVGKIGISDAVLLKASKLTVAEFEAMKRHTLIGGRLLSGGKSEVLNMARQIALTHHERWDGNGYPHGLAGSEIPLVGRIVALADVFDALLHKRPYKSAWEKTEALAELARQRGRHFDPELTDAALLVFGSGRYEAALLGEDQGAASSLAGGGSDAANWELESMRLQYERLLEARTRELETTRAQAEVQVEQLRRAAYTDALTGLHNRRAFEADLLNFAEEAHQDGRPLGLISLDLDDLKYVNDAGGHASGDALLSSVARQLQQQFEPAGRVYRMGGDEYAVLLWKDPELVSRELDGEVHRLEAELRRQGHPATLSAGYASWPHDTVRAEELLQLSDERMYEQKRRRKLGPSAAWPLNLQP